jgi:hypothetical protein
MGITRFGRELVVTSIQPSPPEKKNPKNVTYNFYLLYTTMSENHVNLVGKNVKK